MIFILYHDVRYGFAFLLEEKCIHETTRLKEYSGTFSPSSLDKKYTPATPKSPGRWFCLRAVGTF